MAERIQFLIRNHDAIADYFDARRNGRADVPALVTVEAIEQFLDAADALAFATHC